MLSFGAALPIYNIIDVGVHMLRTRHYCLGFEFGGDDNSSYR